jgi:hypothetical protein
VLETNAFSVIDSSGELAMKDRLVGTCSLSEQEIAFMQNVIKKL